ncbi:hypothetical protein SSBG_05870 [Streptomyces sp. SPB074]|nr:hypothetical protein SSBG_05870 [Streptomyces sp. SPB074]
MVRPPPPYGHRPLRTAFGGACRAFPRLTAAP